MTGGFGPWNFKELPMRFIINWNICNSSAMMTGNFPTTTWARVSLMTNARLDNVLATTSFMSTDENGVT